MHVTPPPRYFVFLPNININWYNFIYHPVLVCVLLHVLILFAIFAKSQIPPKAIILMVHQTQTQNKLIHLHNYLLCTVHCTYVSLKIPPGMYVVVPRLIVVCNSIAKGQGRHLICHLYPPPTILQLMWHKPPIPLWIFNQMIARPSLLCVVQYWSHKMIIVAYMFDFLSHHICCFHITTQHRGWLNMGVFW